VCGEIVRLGEKEARSECTCGNLTLKAGSDGVLLREHEHPFAEMSISKVISSIT
jgi:hypothetical protein